MYGLTLGCAETRARNDPRSIQHRRLWKINCASAPTGGALSPLGHYERTFVN